MCVHVCVCAVYAQPGKQSRVRRRGYGKQTRVLRGVYSLLASAELLFCELFIGCWRGGCFGEWSGVFARVDWAESLIVVVGEKITLVVCTRKSISRDVLFAE